MKQKSKKKNYNVIKCNTPAKKYEKRKPIKILKCHKKNVLLIAKRVISRTLLKNLQVDRESFFRISISKKLKNAARRVLIFYKAQQKITEFFRRSFSPASLMFCWCYG